MKKFIVILCLLSLCLPLCACSSASLEPEAPAKKEETAEKTQQKDKGPLTYPKGVFSVGYGIGDITCTTPLPIYNGIAHQIHDPLMLTVTAFCDGQDNVALVMSADLKGMHRPVFERTASIIETKFHIPRENIILSCTHTHSAPTVGETNAEVMRWAPIYYQTFPAIVEEALRDLDPVEAAYGGKSQAESISFVRRYLLEDGTYKMNPSAADKPVEHESVADNELRTVRFDRKNKKDVLMVNFQTHYGGQVPANMLSADFVHPFRKQAQEEWDCLFAYYSGAGGNINFKSEIPGERYYEEPSDAIAEFMGSTQRAMDAEEEAALGKVSCARSMYPGKVRHDPEERVKQAQEVVSAGYETEKGISLMAQYGFDSHFEPAFIVTRSRLGETLDIPMTAVSFGEIAFTGHPYEMFHENGKEVRDGSPFKTTFICSLSGDALGYIPSALGYSNGGYETFNCRFAAGTGEELAQEAIRLLNQCKNAA